MMTGFDGGGYGLLGLILVLFFLVLVVLGVVLVARGLRSSGAAPSAGPSVRTEYPPEPPRSTALAILEERYARGEIDREEFSARKSDLTG